MLHPVTLFAPPWTVAYQTPLFMEFSRQEYWGGLPFPSPWDLPNPRIKPWSPELQADSLPSEPPEKLIFYIFLNSYKIIECPKYSTLKESFLLENYN